MPRAPGQILLTLARRLLSHTEIDQVIEPVIADLQHEWSASGPLAVPWRLFVRARAYFCAVRVVGPRLITSSLGRTLALPSWSIVWPMIGPSLTIMIVLVLVGTFGPASTRTRDHWLFYLPDRILWFLPMMPARLGGWSRSLRTERILLQLRASDVAKLSVFISLFCLAWSGWMAPLVRQQYLLSLNLENFVDASVHQWTITQLLGALQGAPDVPAAVVVAEVHLRLLPPALALTCGALGWATVRAMRVWNNALAPLFWLAGLVTLIVLLRVGGFATPRLSYERIAVEWAALAAVVMLGMVAIRLLARTERRRRAALEARAIALLKGIADRKLALDDALRGKA